jgi:hypothetical protein
MYVYTGSFDFFSVFTIIRLNFGSVLTMYKCFFHYAKKYDKRIDGEVDSSLQDLKIRWLN